MSFVISLLVRFGLSDAVAKRWAPLAALAGVIVALGLLWGAGNLAWQAFDWFNDRDAIQRDRIERENVEAQAALEAERRAAEAEAKRAAARAAASDKTTDKLKEIEDDDPEAAKAPAPAGSRAVADRLRTDGGG